MPKPEPVKLLNVVKKYRPTFGPLVPTMYIGMINHPDISKVDFSKLKLSIGGGMAVLKPVAHQWKKLTNVLLMEGYGLTECSPVVCLLRCGAV